MPITKRAARQQIINAYVDISYADLTSGAAADAIQLPPNAVVISGFVQTTAAFNSGTSDALVIGDSVTANRYLTSTSIRTANAVNALTVTGYQPTTQSHIQVTWTGGGAAPTAGSLRLYVNYVVIGREQFSQG